MLTSRAKDIFNTKIKAIGGLNPPTDAELNEFLYEAMIYAATKCIPNELLRSSENENETAILRFIGGGDFIVLPEMPNVSDDLQHLQIDEELSYAVINKAVSLFCRDLNHIRKFENEADNAINRYKANYSKIKGKGI